MTFISCLFCLVFRSRRMFLDMSFAKVPVFRKNTSYRLKNATRIHWMCFTTLLSAKIIGETAGTVQKLIILRIVKRNSGGISGKSWFLPEFLNFNTSLSFERGTFCTAPFYIPWANLARRPEYLLVWRLLPII